MRQSSVATDPTTCLDATGLAAELPMSRVPHPRDPAISCLALQGHHCPTGAFKDVAVGHLLGVRRRSGELQPGDTVVIPSSGNAGISAAYWCSALGLHCVVFLPPSASDERARRIEEYGGVVRRAGRTLAEAISAAEAFAAELGHMFLDQFADPLIAQGYPRVARRVADALAPAEVAALVAGTGTAGTLVGFASEFATRYGRTVIAYRARPVADGRSCDRIPGIVEGVTKLLPPAGTAGWETVDVEHAEVESVWEHLVTACGFEVGKSAALNVAAAWVVSRRLGPDAIVLTVFPDHLNRYPEECIRMRAIGPRE